MANNKIDKDKITSILATDCGSTTTKAILIEKRENGEFRLAIRGEAPTTVEAPVEDVTQGVLNAVTEVEELAKRPILTKDKKNILKPKKGNEGVDIYISTSSAGGGLQMVVGGVVSSMSAESAARAALGGGGIVMDVLAVNDGRKVYERIEKIRNLRPDMILLAGGVDGGTVSHVVEMAHIISAADPKPRLGISFKLPVIFAGNVMARKQIERILKDKVDLEITDNLRPTLERENLMPARQKIQKLFLEHVMQQAPGYNKLMTWTDVPIMPTPAAVGSLMQRLAEKEGIQVLGADIGGATTDMFSVFKGIYNRTVSANYGMSYSISNVMADAGWENVIKWVPYHIDARDFRNRIKNKMIRPTTIPLLLEELMIEQALAREALRLSLEQHKQLAVSLKGVQQERSIADIFTQAKTGQSLVDMLTLDMIIGSGGVLSHAPRRVQSALMMIDAFLPEGVTTLTVDSIFMMPHLGVLATVHPDAAINVFEKDCLVYIGSVVAPIGYRAKEGEKILDIDITFPDGRQDNIELKFMEMKLIPLGLGEKAKAILKPSKRFDMGEGRGKAVEKELVGGVVGVILDGRGRRPFKLPEDRLKRVEKLQEWYEALNVYPEIKNANLVNV